MNCALFIDLCYFYRPLWIKRTLLFFNYLNIEQDADSERQLSPNLTLRDYNSPNKFTTQFTTPRLTDTKMYCIYEDNLIMSEGARMTEIG